MDKILVTPKIHPDLDGASCCLAYASLLNQTGYAADGIITGEYQPEVKYFTEVQKILIPSRQDLPTTQWQKFILVDASSMKGMPKVVDQKFVIEIIDHREGESEKEFPQAKIQNELIGAAATIIVERYQQAQKLPSPEIAQLLYGAIYHNTLNFNSPNTTTRDKTAFSWLSDNFSPCRPKLVLDMFNYASQNIYANITDAVRQDAKEFAASNISVGAYQLIVTGFNPIQYQSQIETAVYEQDKLYQCPISYISISDINAKKTYFYVPNEQSQTVLSACLNLKFTNQWAESPLILRKLIMPKIRSYLSHSNS